MLINLIKHSLRSFRRQRSYIIINVFGLSIGIACSLLIAFFILHETSYDSYNVKKDRIFNLALNFKIGGEEMTTAISSAPVGPAILKEFPETEDFLRMMQMSWVKSIKYDNENYYEDHIMEADSSFFNFFSIPVLKGDRRNLLNAPMKVVLTESAAKRIFGETDPINKTMRLGKDTVLYTVTGVMADIPARSHFKADILISFMSDNQANDPGWMNNRVSTYLLFKPNTSYKNVDDKLPELTIKYVGPEIKRFLNLSFDEFIARGNKYGYRLQKLTDIHLDTSVRPHFEPSGDPGILKILTGIAILILLIAAINFTNLSTVQSSRRAKEVGIKKLGGSTKGFLIAQFLSESIILTFISTILGLVIIKIILPYFNGLLGTRLQVDLFTKWSLIPALILFSLAVGILAGIYPSLFLASFNPYEVLKGKVKNSMQNGRLRRVLVVFQFTVSIILIVGTLVMYKQIIYMLKTNTGFNKEQLIVLENIEILDAKLESFKNELMMIPGVKRVSCSCAVPGRANNDKLYMLEGNKDESIILWTNYVDYDYLETYEMSLVSGRIFNKQYSADNQACIVNEAAIKKFGIDPEKKRIMMYNDSGKLISPPIIGVVKNFVFESLRNQISPYIIRMKPDRESYRFMTLKISAGNYSRTLGEIEDQWKKITGNEPFKFYFMDEVLEQLYIKEKQNGRIAIISSILSIFVAVLGLFGLTSFTVEQRTKEIGVRKAMGSSIAGIYLQIMKEIFILVSISALIAFPLIFYFSGKWLENFYYRIHPGFFTFFAGLCIVTGIAVLTVSYRVIRAALVNPAQSLKYE